MCTQFLENRNTIYFLAMITKEYLYQCGFRGSASARGGNPDGKTRFRFFDFVAYGDLLDIVLVLSEDQWLVEEIRTTGELSKSLVEKYVPNRTPEEAVAFVTQQPWV